jgi:hypothetical protein
MSAKPTTRGRRPAWFAARLFAAGLLLLAVPVARAEDRAPAWTCVDVRIGTDAYYDCLNGELRNLVPRQRLSSRDTPWPATQPANEVGTFSLPAIRERMGTGFGHSVVAQRPAPPVYPSPLLLAPPR